MSSVDLRRLHLMPLGYDSIQLLPILLWLWLLLLLLLMLLLLLLLLL